MAMKQFEKDSKFTRYAQAPFSVLESGLSPNAKLLLIWLIDRIRMSQAHDQYIDEQGMPFVWAKQETMAGWLGISTNQVATHLRSLEEAGFIRQRRVGLGQANRIYIYLPEDSFAKPDGSCDEAE